MRKIKIILMAMPLLLTTVAMAQGIRFEQDLSWKQILAKAKKENKYVFVDAMATWCAPCGEMEKKIYPDSALTGLADKFVSIKVQMDKTANDNDFIKSWYADARSIRDKYEVTAFPTFLFFSPQGKIVHRGVGMMDVGRFMVLMTEALDYNKQYYGKYYALVNNYKKGRKDYLEMPYMVEMSKKVKKPELEQKIALDYIHNYLLKLVETELYVEKNLRFISSYVDSNDEDVFKIFYPDGTKADKIVAGISRSVLSKIITEEEINARIIEGNDYRRPKVNEPNWMQLGATINEKYGFDGARELNKAKRAWYRISKPDGNELAKATLEYFTKYKPISKMVGWLDPWSAANTIYNDIALEATNKEILSKAARLQFEVITKYKEERQKYRPSEVTKTAAFLDTYACLLYKAGAVDIAIKVLEIAVEEDPSNKELNRNLAAMKNGETLKLK